MFEEDRDFILFLRIVDEARSLCPMRILAYCLMSNHWHFLLWPENEGDLSRFMHWLTGTHARRWREEHGNQGEGAVYQSRFTSVPMYDDWQVLAAWRYIELNPVAAHLTSRAEDWRWSSAARHGRDDLNLELDAPPFPLPVDWLRLLHEGFDLALDVDSL